MGPRVWRLLLAGALVCAVLGTGAGSGTTSGGSERTEPITVVLARPAVPVDAAVVPVRHDRTVTLLAAARSSFAALRDWAGADGFTVPGSAVIACLAVALGVCVRLDVAPTARLGLARRRGPPALLLVRT